MSNSIIVKSSGYLLEIMPAGMNKAKGIRKFCEIFGIATEDSVAFGDNYNDLEMLYAVYRCFNVEMPPAAILETFPGKVTLDNNHDGIPVALKDLGMI
ncbi:MAG: HAD family hydrolase [Anaerobutyricum sp.]